MRTRHAALTAALLLGLTACGTADNPPATPSGKGGAEAGTQPPAPTTSSAFLRPTPEQEKTLLAALTKIDPNLTVKEERAISRSVGVCDDIRKGKDDATVVKNAAYRYNGGTASVDETKGAQIVEVIKTAYCKN
ncbi:hypothetical protein ACIPQA_16415 [Streptomyces sp. NPDC090109]|uniref:hypothetical protein n=1 Tax=Streptomyces sp. NPDC090109 TaxID=3365948 RepID=UPI00382E67E3